ncbi:hypothetical protein [Methanobrevibacter cuticularis]|uniref:hypothetical protein n=1 Tax=Methanobrevibacter cuticularis TaxID=47311 RepID=UPI0014720B02|nr:hypothetical protein [Methanobrevibacter cuticularis]
MGWMTMDVMVCSILVEILPRTICKQKKIQYTFEILINMGSRSWISRNQCYITITPPENSQMQGYLSYIKSNWHYK